MSESGGTEPVGQRELRVSDAEREHVVGLLQKAIGRGLLDLDEFTSRTDTAYAARTRGELNAALVGLPGMVHRDAPRRQTGTRTTPNASRVPTGQGGDHQELTGNYSSIVRTGNWRVPRHMMIRNRYGSTKLDFTQAQIDHDVVEIELASKWGSVLIVVPQHASVSTEEITEVEFGSVNDKRRSAGNGTPHFVVSGWLHGGSLTIRNPRGWLG